MKLKALSHYDNDMDTRFGDCIMLYDHHSLIMYDCGSERHAEEVEKFLKNHNGINDVYIVVSHNDSDHTNGVCSLLEWLHENKQNSNVKVYTHQLLKYKDKITDKIDDKRRNRQSIGNAILEEFNHIKEIIDTARNFGFDRIEAKKDTKVGKAIIVGPTEEDFLEAAVKAIDKRTSDKVGEGDGSETYMNAASVQLECEIEDGNKILLCGDASPDFLPDHLNYNIIQLPHHGRLDNAKAIFNDIEKDGDDPQEKYYLISDNTGSGEKSGGSDDLVEYMKNEKYSPAFNTKDGVVDLPEQINTISSKQTRRPLGDLDCF